MDLQKNLRHYRELAGYKTAKDFANALNIPYNTYTAYENQKREPKLDMIVKIANILNISTDELLGRTVVNKTEQLKNKIISALKHSNDKYFEIKNIDSGMITFTINNDDEKIIDVEIRTKEFSELIEMVENKYKNKIREDIYYLSCVTLIQKALSPMIKNILKMSHTTINETDFEEFKKYILLADKLYEIKKKLKEKRNKQKNK